MAMRWFWQRAQQQGLNGIGLHADGLSFARVLRERGRRPELLACEFLPCEPGEEQQRTLSALVRRRQLQQGACTTVLEGGEYSLLQIEAPDVPASELRQAVRWRIKDQIDFHVDDAAIDVFELPGQTQRAGPRMMCAVAARASAVRGRVDRLLDSGAGLQVVDIAELALRNLAALLPEDVHGVALLYFGREQGLLALTRQAELYLARGIGLGADRLRFAAAEDAAALERLVDAVALEVQRSLDYYESHFGLTPIRHLALAPLEQDVPGLGDALASRTGLEVLPLDLNAQLDCPDVLPASVQARCLLTVGAALRLEERAL
jgi:MSHA biogenesis protein MshI